MTLQRTHAALALFMVGLLVLAGCLGTNAPPSGTDDGAAEAATPREAVPITDVVPAAPQVLVSPPGHRMAEFMVARSPLDPDHLVIGVMDYDSGTGALACVTYVSRDGGASWTQSQKVPGLDRSHLQFDPWLSFDQDGTLHYICLDTAGPTAQTWPYYSMSTDGGMTWSPAVLIPTASEGQSIDKSSIHAGRDGTVYAAFSGQVARTHDHGATWQRGASTGAGSNPNGFVEDGEGNVYLWTRGGGNGRVARTSDGGETWNVTTVGPFAIPPGYNDQTRWVDQRPWTTLPTIAIHPWTDGVFVAQQSWDNADELFKIHLYRSVDRAQSFEERSVPEFASSTCAPCHVTKPSIVFDDDGRLGMLVQLNDDGGHTKEVWFSASADDGATWVEPIVLSKTSIPNGWANPNAFVPRPEGFLGLAQNLAGDPGGAGPMVVGLALTTLVSELQMRWNGEYWGIGASTQGFVAVWIDHSADGVPQLYTRLVRAE